MSKRKSPAGSELREPSMPSSPEVAQYSSSGEWPQFSSSSPASSVSYTSKIPPIKDEENVHRGNATPETKAMDLVGCPRCFMYVMLSEVDPKCPKCKSTVFLEFFKDDNFKPDN